MSGNKQNKANVRRNVKRLKPKKKNKFGFSNIWLIFGGFIIFSMIFNFVNSPLEANEINFNDLIDNIKNNKYSSVQVRDDGKVVGQEKYLFGAEYEEIQLDKIDGTVVNKSVDSDLEEMSLDQLVKAIQPASFTDLLNALKNPDEYTNITDIYVSDEFIVANNKSDDEKDFIIDANEDELLNKLQEKDINTEELDTAIHYLRTSLAVKDVDQIESFYSEERFSEVWVLDDIVIARLHDEEVNSDFVWQLNNDVFDLFIREGISLDSRNVKITTVVIPRIPWGDLLTLAILISFGVLAVFMFRGVQGSGNSLMKFGQSKARLIFGRKQDITFKDVAGVDEAKEELNEIVLFLKEPKRFLNMGARIPKGVLMVGSPGTGKTLLARAIAGEAGVPFFHTSGSEFEEMLVGAGASRVRDLFEKAKKAAPAIIFIDEIDAVARKRGTTVQSGTTEQTLNQILVEMDGFEKNTNVIVIAATNRPDVLDTAILRPGRFDRRVVLDLPDIEGRKQIIKIHMKGKPVSDKVDFEKVARRTVGFSGADIENMLNEAAIIVAKADRKEILFDDLEEAANKVQIGPAKKRKRSSKELEMTAYHEAGHALVMKLTPEHDPVHRVTIVSRGMALGYTMPLPEKDEVQMTKTKMLSKITSLVAGFATEQLIYGDVTSGASNDIEKATSIARKMVKQFGMSKKLGLVKYGQGDDAHLGYQYENGKNYSESTSQIIDEEVRGIIDECYERATKLITDNKATLDAIVKVLLEKEVIDSEEFEGFFKK